MATSKGSFRPARTGVACARTLVPADAATAAPTKVRRLTLVSIGFLLLFLVFFAAMVGCRKASREQAPRYALAP